MQENEIAAIETQLLETYASQYGTGSSVFIRFKQFLLQTPAIKSRGRLVVSNAKFPTIVRPESAGKEPGAQQGSQPPALKHPQQNTPPNPPKSEDHVADVDFFDVLKQDVNTMSITQVASKYTKEQLTEYAKSLGVETLEDLNEKQIVKAINQKLKNG